MPMTMIVAFAVMLAVDGRVVGTASRCKVGCCLVGLALYAAVEADARFLQGILCACADAAADQHIDVLLREQCDQSAVPGPVVLDDARLSNCPVGHLIECQLPATEVASLRESFDTSICLDRPGLLHSQSCEVQQRSGNYQSH